MTRIAEIQSSRVKNFFHFQRDPLGFLLGVLHEGDVVSLRTSSFRPTFIVNAPDFVQEILVAKESYFRKGRSSGVLRRTVGDGLLTSESPVHAHQKKYMAPVFYKERIQTYAGIVEEETERLADSLEEGKPVPMHEITMKLTLGIIARSLFATELEERKAELAAAVDDTIRQSAKAIFSPVILPLSIPTKGNLTHKRAIRKLERVVYDAIAHARRHPDRYADTLLGLLLDTRDEEGRPIPEREIRDQMMTMLLAGHETTAVALVWALYSLDRAPEAADKLHAELDRLRSEEEVAGADAGGVASSAFERFRKLTYTQMTIQETLRLFPPAWAILREAEREVGLLGETFVAGSSFLISPYAIHRNDNVFGDALAFRPDRFEGGIAQWPKFAYFPFGGGARGCIGSQFAMMEATLILAGLTGRFTFASVDREEAVPEPLVSLRVKNGLWMIPKRRSRTFD